MPGTDFLSTDNSALASTALSLVEMSELAQCEAVIARGLLTFTEVGSALLVIRDKRLYRAGYKTFEGYCRERWEMSRIHAHRMIEAAKITSNLLPIGNILPSNEAQSRPLSRLQPKDQGLAWQRAVETAPSGKVTAAHVRRIVDEEFMPQPMAQAMAVTVYSHKSTEYYTPRVYVEAGREVMGGIDLDPASCDAAQKIVNANRYYTSTEDGLKQRWFGRVWLNPPYSKTGGESNQAIWSQRLISEYESGNVSQAVMLVKAALGYKWFEDIWVYWPVCFARERLAFIKSDGTSDGQSKQATAFFYLGSDYERFMTIFRQFGRVIPPEAR